ncbi:MAG: hypothetical protein R3A52_28855 [Polyangiales bacterium]
MSIFDRLRGAKPRATVTLPPAIEALAAAVVTHESREVDDALLRARLADACRDAGVEPLSPVQIEVRLSWLDAEGWRRLAALAAAIEHPSLAAAFASALQTHGAEKVIGVGLVDTSARRPLLTMATLRKSTLRVEELLRAALAAAEIDVAGETAEQSKTALARLDLARVQQLAEQAKADAAARMEKLKAAQEADDAARNPRRGKW